MPFVDLPSGSRLHYEDIDEVNDPSRAPVIVVHGMLGTAKLHFANVIEWLKPSYRVIGPSMRGYGESLPKPRTFTHDFYHRDAADVLALMDALDIPQAHLLGYSDGGEISLIAAGTQPERVKSVAVWGAVGYFGPALRPVVQRMYPADWLTDEEMAIHGITDRNDFVLSWMHAAKAMIDSGGDVSLSLAPNITAPLLLMLGDQDTLNPEAYGQVLVDKTPNGRLQMFPCGHAVHDLVWDAFKVAVGEHLAANT